MWMAGACGLKRAGIANARLYVPIHNVKQRRTHRREPGNDDAELQSRDALRIRAFCHAARKLASNGREAMSLLAKMSLPPKEGGGAPNGAPIPVATPQCAGAAAAR
jgi:hypothetical protein